MRVRIDQDECCGVGVCVEACPQLFEIASDGLAYLRDANGRQAAVVSIPPDDGLVESVLDAAEDCPQDCIYLESDSSRAVA